MKVLRSVHLLTALFDQLCREKFDGRVYSLILFLKTRWSTAYYMFARLKMIKQVACSIPSAIAMYDNLSHLSIDSKLTNILTRSVDNE